MPSLVKKMFDTMPLQGVLGAVAKVVGASQPPTLGQMKQHMKVHRAPPTYDAKTSVPAMETKADDAAIWGWHTESDPSRVTNVTCRVRDMGFAKYLVLESLDFGYAPLGDAKHLRPDVLVVFNGDDYVLPLSSEYHLVSFTTNGGYIKADKNAELWPLESYHDESLLHVFAYDIDRVSLAILPLNDPQHPDKKGIDAMLNRLDELTKAGDDDTRNANEVLYKDDLWDPSPANTPPTGTVPEDVNLSLLAVRVLVVCSLTACRERDDFQPGKLGGVGRLYPHVMVVATSALDRVDAGVHFKRPEVTTPRPDPEEHHHAHHHMSGADEMLPPLKSLLIADANVKGMTLAPVPIIAGGPLPFWANMFSYYVVDPIDDPGVGQKLIPVVRRSTANKVRNQVGWVTRDCSDVHWVDAPDTWLGSENVNRVVKRERQGYFDNIHIAPRMRVTETITAVAFTADGGVLDGLTPPSPAPADLSAWKMDQVVMAPFCAHDCFHLHWRWSDNMNDEKATWGWGPVSPHVLVGKTMVPENQDVFLQILGDAEITYLAQAHTAPKDAWQPFCHHGCGYALHVGTLMVKARDNVWKLDEMTFIGSDGKPLNHESWALFYWRLRYRLAGDQKLLGAFKNITVEERFSFTVEHKALDE